jgi:pimeloyl-ACP methyl ester carboxylesterase
MWRQLSLQTAEIDWTATACFKQMADRLKGRADRPRHGDAGDLFGGRVERSDGAFAVRRDDGVCNRSQHHTQPFMLHSQQSVRYRQCIGGRFGITSRFSQFLLETPSFGRIEDGDGNRSKPAGLVEFEREDIDDLLDTLESNHFGWARMMAPVVMGNPDRPELAGALGDSFCRMDSTVASHFARVTFLSDHRADLQNVSIPSLLLQCSDDALAAPAVGDYLSQQMAGSSLVRLAATGHCPHMSAPLEVSQVLSEFLGQRL